eukprot:jgi/Mesen1/3269/ME000019S02684
MKKVSNALHKAKAKAKEKVEHAKIELKDATEHLTHPTCGLKTDSNDRNAAKKARKKAKKDAQKTGIVHAGDSSGDGQSSQVEHPLTPSREVTSVQDPASAYSSQTQGSTSDIFSVPSADSGPLSGNISATATEEQLLVEHSFGFKTPDRQANNETVGDPARGSRVLFSTPPHSIGGSSPHTPRGSGRLGIDLDFINDLGSPGHYTPVLGADGAPLVPEQAFLLSPGADEPPRSPQRSPNGSPLVNWPSLLVSAPLGGKELKQDQEIGRLQPHAAHVVFLEQQKFPESQEEEGPSAGFATDAAYLEQGPGTAVLQSRGATKTKARDGGLMDSVDTLQEGGDASALLQASSKSASLRDGVGSAVRHEDMSTPGLVPLDQDVHESRVEQGKDNSGVVERAGDLGGQAAFTPNVLLLESTPDSGLHFKPDDAEVGDVGRGQGLSHGDRSFNISAPEEVISDEVTSPSVDMMPVLLEAPESEQNDVSGGPQDLVEGHGTQQWQGVDDSTYSRSDGEGRREVPVTHFSQDVPEEKTSYQINEASSVPPHSFGSPDAEAQRPTSEEAQGAGGPAFSADDGLQGVVPIAPTPVHEDYIPLHVAQGVVEENEGSLSREAGSERPVDFSADGSKSQPSGVGAMSPEPAERSMDATESSVQKGLVSGGGGGPSEDGEASFTPQGLDLPSSSKDGQLQSGHADLGEEGVEGKDSELEEMASEQHLQEPIVVDTEHDAGKALQGTGIYEAADSGVDDEVLDHAGVPGPEAVEEAQVYLRGPALGHVERVGEVHDDSRAPALEHAGRALDEEGLESPAAQEVHGGALHKGRGPDAGEGPSADWTASKEVEVKQKSPEAVLPSLPASGHDGVPPVSDAGDFHEREVGVPSVPSEVPDVPAEVHDRLELPPALGSVESASGEEAPPSEGGHLAVPPEEALQEDSDADLPPRVDSISLLPNERVIVDNFFQSSRNVLAADESHAGGGDLISESDTRSRSMKSEESEAGETRPPEAEKLGAEVSAAEEQVLEPPAAEESPAEEQPPELTSAEESAAEQQFQESTAADASAAEQQFQEPAAADEAAAEEQFLKPAAADEAAAQEQFQKPSSKVASSKRSSRGSTPWTIGGALSAVTWGVKVFLYGRSGLKEEEGRGAADGVGLKGPAAASASEDIHDWTLEPGYWPRTPSPAEEEEEEGDTFRILNGDPNKPLSELYTVAGEATVVAPDGTLLPP